MTKIPSRTERKITRPCGESGASSPPSFTHEVGQSRLPRCGRSGMPSWLGRQITPDRRWYGTPPFRRSFTVQAYCACKAHVAEALQHAVTDFSDESREFGLGFA